MVLPATRSGKMPSNECIDDDRKRVLVVMKDFGGGDRKWLDRLYHIEVPDTKDLFGAAPVTNSLRAYFTLRIIP